METIPLQNAQLDTPSSIHAILKIAGAVITALITPAQASIASLSVVLPDDA
jgi:hypothetical protein